MKEPYEPPGLRFFDARSRREMLLVTEGSFEGWICYRHPDGQWVSLRKATDDDRERIRTARCGKACGLPELNNPDMLAAAAIALAKENLRLRSEAIQQMRAAMPETYRSPDGKKWTYSGPCPTCGHVRVKAEG